MYTDDDLDRAVAAGALAPEAAAAFRAFIAREKAQPAVDEEHFRLLTGFNDIFVSIAALLILIAVAWLGGQVHAALAGGAMAAASWGLAEYFTRRRRMALPSILLLLSFVGGVFMAVFGSLAPEGRMPFDEGVGLRVGGAGALAAVAAWLHWRRFMVPITVAAGTGAALLTVLALIFGSAPQLMKTWFMPSLFVAGLAAFALAMWWDASDRARTTRRSDVAFWLHLGAAPLLVHPIFFEFLTGGQGGVGLAGLVVVLYVLLALVALAIDRRALLISALAYVLYAISALFNAAGSLTESLALTGLVIGSALLMLSAFWHAARRAVVAKLPAAWQARLPLVEGEGA